MVTWRMCYSLYVVQSRTYNSSAAGVHQYRVHTQSSKWVYNRCGLTNAEWISCLKMTVNGAPVRSLHGRSKDGPACRAPGCEAEREALSHVLGSCHKGNLLRNARHNKIRPMIAEVLRGKDGLEVEVPCIAENGSSRRVDIIIIDRGKSQAWIVDLTVRYEGGEQQATEVDNEKKRIYEPCVRDLKGKYRMEEYEVEVIGLYTQIFGTGSASREKIFLAYGKPSTSLSLSFWKTDQVSTGRKSCAFFRAD
ncbi:hypothetical protein RvY_17698 [Ramazzottius varieornatus]|uniref:Reverse transcriptase n=1 Tax=Ramazzottius varieornatus TaxID=947166 RepID=A0A1D1W310_RAMVA|nr:hypothetical protein RvY_17698 [Ramazzottius varieornatus]